MRGELLDDGVAAACGGGGVHGNVDDADFRDDLLWQELAGNLFELLSSSRRPLFSAYKESRFEKGVEHVILSYLVSMTPTG
jgi:hypothetical protein